MSPSDNNGPTSGPSAVGNIKHVIALMFENRSFDHLLGAMPGVDGVLDAQGNVLPNLYNTMDPTAKPGDDNPATPPTPIVPFLNPAPPLPAEDQLLAHARIRTGLTFSPSAIATRRRLRRCSTMRNSAVRRSGRTARAISQAIAAWMSVSSSGPAARRTRRP